MKNADSISDTKKIKYFSFYGDFGKMYFLKIILRSKFFKYKSIKLFAINTSLTVGI